MLYTHMSCSLNADISAEDLAPTPAAPAEVVKPDVSTAQEMPVEEAVKVIGGTQAGSAPVSEAPTAGKALDSVLVGPDPAAAGSAADDKPQDGDYFLDANLADSMLVGLVLVCLGVVSGFYCPRACSCGPCIGRSNSV